MRNFLVAFTLALVLAVGAVGVVSAHAGHREVVAQSCATLRADLINALNTDQAEDSILPDGVVTDAADLALANARAALIADGCSSNGSSGFVPGYRFPGGYPYGFGANTTTGDPILCQDTLNAIARMDTRDQQQFATWGLTARYQTCAGTIPLSISPVTSPFSYGDYCYYRSFCY